ncbi:hypothetical protein PTSG_08919 [Salpingoeca rosetta]|uniref:Uncharacterized protein n=1 Tax=Salpingoeca rosetta (strain ATCC 50818 / BSB-021) TaxID=946362 RepID=F2UL29_SALR5|nr:uncharacterized protein PTSG_08919 [Salpingoeca rosetta]EGD77828.1 hypothetical protein PTSG_08919 [Salpingoeca rosetta]|eukprot:XP_004990304.1 hypothetical protein PTSG_08919 [Salpingoeca rosetta]
MGRSAVGVRMCVSGAQASKVLINTATCSQPSTRQQLRTMLVGRQEEEDERGDRGAQQQQQLARCLENTGQLTQSEAGLIQDGFGSVQRFSSATQHSLLACR